MDPLWEQRVADKQASRDADDAAVARGAKSVEQVARESYVFAGLNVSFNPADQRPVQFYDRIPGWL